MPLAPAGPTPGHQLRMGFAEDAERLLWEISTAGGGEGAPLAATLLQLSLH